MKNSGPCLEDGVTINHPHDSDASECTFGIGGVIRKGTIIYNNVHTGDNFQTGHNVMIRGGTHIGDHVLIGTGTTIDGQVTIGSFVKIEANCYIPTHIKIGNRVFIGPNVTLTNDRYPLKMREEYIATGPQGPIVEDYVTIGGGATICPGVRIGRGSFVAAGSVVTRNVPAMSLVIGVPGKIRELPEMLREPNMAISWRELLEDDQP